MFMPTSENYTDMTSVEFEKFVLKLFQELVSEIPNAELKHDIVLHSYDGSYQIDGTITFEIAGMYYLTLIECKMYKGPVSRDKVQILYDKLRAAGAQKGVLVTSSYFQKGALEYANLHGIALVQIIDGKLMYHVRSNNLENIEYPDFIQKFTAVALNNLGPSSVGVYTIDKSDYLLNFIQDKQLL